MPINPIYPFKIYPVAKPLSTSFSSEQPQIVDVQDISDLSQNIRSNSDRKIKSGFCFDKGKVLDLYV